MSNPKFELQKGRFFLAEDYVYTFPWDNTRSTMIKSGARTNFASIPQLLEWLVSSDDRHLVFAAYLHDQFVNEFGNQALIRHHDRLYVPTWKESAEIMRKVMIDQGAKWWKHTLVYCAVMAHGIKEGKV